MTEVGDSPVAPGTGAAAAATPGHAAEAPIPPRGTRSSRVAGAVQVNYVYQAAVLVAGLWLTPFLIREIGNHDYGLWLAGAQIVAWMYVMDLGVVALLPRETAFAVGRSAGTGDQGPVTKLIDQTTMILLWQLPVVALVTAVAWGLLPEEEARLRGPLLVVFGVFLVGFPLRVFPAVLQGVQDIVYASAQTFIGWAIGFVLTVVLVRAGLGLYALAIGYAAVQVYQYATSWVRLRTRHRGLLPSRLTPLRWAQARGLLASGVWVSISQIAQVLLVGTDILVITKVLGPAAVVPYAITGKLAAVLSNQPSTIMVSALPAISEIRGTSDMERLQRVASSLSQLMLILSSLVFCVVLVVNESFIDWWGVPDNPYAGDLLTGIILTAMVARHANFAVVYTLFSLGGEKRISITTLADGVVTVVGAIILVRAFGIIGAPVASLLGVFLISLPANLRGLSARARIPVLGWLQPLWGWTWRFILLAAGSAILARQSIPVTFVGLALASAAVTIVVLAMMAPIALRPPLGDYLRPRLHRLFPRWIA